MGRVNSEMEIWIDVWSVFRCFGFWNEEFWCGVWFLAAVDEDFDAFQKALLIRGKDFWYFNFDV